MFPAKTGRRMAGGSDYAACSERTPGNKSYGAEQQTGCEYI